MPRSTTSIRTRIGVTGGSAGGHLAQFLGVTADVKEFEGDGGNPEQSSRVACVVNFYGPSDFTKSYGKSVDAAQVLPLFLGGDLDNAPHRHIVASPLYWVTPDAAPTLCIHGTEDKYVAHEQAVWLIDRLKAAGRRGRAADARRRRPRLQGQGRGEGRESHDRVLRQASEEEVSRVTQQCQGWPRDGVSCKNGVPKASFAELHGLQDREDCHPGQDQKRRKERPK